MNYWELIAEGLSREGWTWGHCSSIEAVGFSVRKMWMVDAYRTDEPRFVVHADDILTAFLEVELQCRASVSQ